MSNEDTKTPIKEDKEHIEAKVENEAKKTSMQILSELFSSFDAEPPVIVKKEKDKSDKSPKKSKKSKKKHKHKDKKHKKKSKRRRSSDSSSDSEIDLAKILIKKEKDLVAKKIKIEGTSLTVDISTIKKESEYKGSSEKSYSRKHSSGHIKREKRADSDSESGRHNRDKESKHREKRKSHRSPERTEKKFKSEDLRFKIKSTSRSDKARNSSDEQFYRNKDDSCDRNWRESVKEDRSKDRKSYDDKYTSKYDDYFKSRERDPNRDRHKHSEGRSFSKEKHRNYPEPGRQRERHREEPSSSSSSHIDKKKLLEIARKNAIQMMKSGSLPGAINLGPQAKEKVIAAIKSGGKTIEELTDFCKTLSKKEELGELSSCSERDDSENDEPFHHPFQIKERPTSITMNIKNSVPLPTKTTQERSTELRMQFPVSSGQQHRVTEEWVPVSPSKTEKPKPKPVPPPTQTSVGNEAEKEKPAVTAAPVSAGATPAPVSSLPGPQMVPTSTPEPNLDIGSVVSQRLTAMRKLQENPNDVQAISQVYKMNKELQSWAQSKQQFGQFTGTTGAQILSQSELTSGFQAWAKRDQLQNAAPVSGGMGMHLLQKMGWKPGEGLGKEKTGTLEPLLLEVKLDKKGLVANEEQSKAGSKKKNKGPTVKSLQGKHPVSLLGEFASKRKIGAPEYVLDFECGPDHKKNFLFRVIVNGVEYKPNVASANKKEAKAAAATIALQQIGLLP